MAVSDPVEYAVALWPRADWGIAIKNLWRRALARHPQDVVVTCIENVREQRSSERVELAWVLREISAWKRNWEGHDLEKEPAQRHREPIDETEAEWENDEILRTLEQQDEATLSRLMAEVSTVAPLRQSSGPCRTWSRLARGLVWAHGGEHGLWPVPPLDLNRDQGPSFATAGSASTAPTTPPSSGARWVQQPSKPSPAPGSQDKSKGLSDWLLSST